VALESPVTPPLAFRTWEARRGAAGQMWQRASEWAAQGELRPSGTERNDSFLLSLLAPVVVGGFL